MDAAETDFTPLNGSDPPAMVEAMNDYASVCNMMERWKLPNSHRPFRKSVVMLLGITSSGKSSLINALLGLSVKSVGVQQMDTHFTMVEVVEEEEFASLSPSYSFRTLSSKQLQQPFEDPHADPRRGIVFAHLDTASTLARHSQFAHFSNLFRRHELVECVLVNARYVTADNDAQRRMALNTIFIDSPGFTAEIELKDLRTNLSVLQYLYSLSNLTLFCIACDSINLVTQQISMLELSILWAVYGEDTFNEMLNRSIQREGAAARLNMADLLFSWVSSKFSSSNSKRDIYEGTSVWDKVRFVLTKADLVDMDVDRVSPVAAQYYELGTTLGTHLQHLRPPVFHQCYAIALPYKTTTTFDFARLEREVTGLDYQFNYANRLELSIQRMCDELQSCIAQSWWAQLARGDSASVKAMYSRSEQRMKSRMQARGQKGGRTCR